jgi:hypothetical protein
MDRLQGGLEVEPGIGRKADLKLDFTADHIITKDCADLREQGAQRDVRGLGKLLVPEDLDELVAPDRSQAVDDEEREEEPALLSGERPLDATAVDVDDESSA